MMKNFELDSLRKCAGLLCFTLLSNSKVTKLFKIWNGTVFLNVAFVAEKKEGEEILVNKILLLIENLFIANGCIDKNGKGNILANYN